MSILHQSAAFAREKKKSGSDDEKQGDDDNEHDEDSSAATVDWTAAFERRDRAGTGKTTTDGLKAVLKEVRRKVAAGWGGYRVGCER